MRLAPFRIFLLMDVNTCHNDFFYLKEKLKLHEIARYNIFFTLFRKNYKYNMCDPPDGQH